MKLFVMDKLNCLNDILNLVHVSRYSFVSLAMLQYV